MRTDDGLLPAIKRATKSGHNSVIQFRAKHTDVTMTIASGRTEQQVIEDDGTEVPDTPTLVAATTLPIASSAPAVATSAPAVAANTPALTANAPAASTPLIVPAKPPAA
ncbi:hypothetical protein SARC_01482 [Sphaeroforma arctica JP610]|uniref:Uncharacterized protein n=1 Tax=Sphaeroforma arctica JP610 TaxID=667725 RepID=A0A0L0GBJ1_9EUKA|nr:hypothetical protein SARC_01482 [Sphaeroforma arctica JP610]KNC86387.1 hypothetical protein SARC_01482 [Sphaeroforma arctica JP610]|eukprot:XP_014160289.1 hypothetical protein SARC_01482 [Sphaeroforma arctica JP610]